MLDASLECETEGAILFLHAADLHKNIPLSSSLKCICSHSHLHTLKLWKQILNCSVSGMNRCDQDRIILFERGIKPH